MIWQITVFLFFYFFIYYFYFLITFMEKTKKNCWKIYLYLCLCGVLFNKTCYLNRYILMTTGRKMLLAACVR